MGGNRFQSPTPDVSALLTTLARTRLLYEAFRPPGCYVGTTALAVHVDNVLVRWSPTDLAYAARLRHIVKCTPPMLVNSTRTAAGRLAAIVAELTLQLWRNAMRSLMTPECAAKM